MATIISAQSGNWNDTTTWVGGVAPSLTDIVTIDNGHTITISEDIQNHQPGEVHVKGNLTIQDGGRLIIGLESPKTYGTFVYYGGSFVKSTGNGSICFPMGNFESAETSATNRAKFSCHMTSQLSDTYKRTATHYINLNYTDFFGNDEQTTGMSLFFQWRATTLSVVGTIKGDGNEFLINHCTFSNMKGTRTTDGTPVAGRVAIRLGESGWTGTGKFFVNIQNSDFRNVDGMLVNGGTSADARDWIMKGCTFHNPSGETDTNKFFLNPGTAEASAQILSENNLFVDANISGTGSAGRWGNIVNSGCMATYTNVLDIVTIGGDGGYYSSNANVECRNCYSYFTDTATNPHAIGIKRIFGYICENERADEANHFMSPDIVQDSFVIGSGDLFNYVGYFTDKSAVIKNNTFVAKRGTYTINSMVLVENSTFTNVSTVAKNNLLYNLGGVASPYPFARWVGEPAAEGKLPIDLSNNLSYPSSTSSEGEGWYADEYTNIAVNPETNISVDPMFIDGTRDLPSATSEYFGYTGSVESNDIIVPYLNSNGYDDSGDTPVQTPAKATTYIHRLNDAMNWIKEGLTPTNMSLATAGEAGTYVGAMMPVAASTGSVSFNGTDITAVNYNGQPINTINVNGIEVINI